MSRTGNCLPTSMHPGEPRSRERRVSLAILATDVASTLIRPPPGRHVRDRR